MTRDQVQEVLTMYELKLRPLVSSRRASLAETDTGQGGRLSHCLWMCEQMHEFLDDGDAEKVMRWLGFVQGVFWCEGVYSIDAMRDHNRPKLDNPAAT